MSQSEKPMLIVDRSRWLERLATMPKADPELSFDTFIFPVFGIYIERDGKETDGFIEVTFKRVPLLVRGWARYSWVLKSDCEVHLIDAPMSPTYTGNSIPVVRL